MDRDSSKIKLGVLYVLMGAGGLWHVLGVFQELMRFLASPLLISLTVWLLYEWFYDANRPGGRISGRGLLLWSALVVCLCFIIEWIGVRSGRIFGNYRYSPTLQPQIAGIPIAIGFAWLNILMGSSALLQQVRIEGFLPVIWVRAALTGVLMVLFDFIMEPAALKLGYWHWLQDAIPLRNYLAWFTIGSGLALWGLIKGILIIPLPRIFYHAYVAQILYFFLASRG